MGKGPDTPHFKRTSVLQQSQDLVGGSGELHFLLDRCVGQRAHSTPFLLSSAILRQALTSDKLYILGQAFEGVLRGEGA